MKVTIWQNETRNGPMYNVTLVRTYKQGEKFNDTASLRFDDLTNAAKLLVDAESWIAGQIARDKAQANGGPATTGGTGRRSSSRTA